jgi:hypothetical protein
LAMFVVGGSANNCQPSKGAPSQINHVRHLSILPMESA